MSLLTVKKQSGSPSYKIHFIPRVRFLWIATFGGVNFNI